MAKQEIDTQVDTTVGLKDNTNPQELGEVVTDYYPDFLNKEDKGKTDAEKAAEYVTQRWRSMKLARGEYEAIWTENEKAYRVEPAEVDEEDEAENWRSTHTTPLTHGMVETAVSEFIDSEPDFEIATEKESQEEGVVTLKKIITHTRYKGDYDFQKQMALRSIGIYGSAIWWEYYREDPRYEKTLTAFDENTGKKTYEIKKITDFNDCYGEVISPYNFGIDENAITIADANDCVRREVLKWSDFIRAYSEFPGFENCKPGGELDKKEPYPSPDGNKDEDEIEILHYYNKPYDIYWIVPNGVLLNDFYDSLPDDHKELPFAEGVFIKMPGHFWGIGLPQILAGTQAELDTNRRLRLDRAKINISKVFLTSAREDLTDADIAMRPGKRIEVSDPSKAVVPLEFSDTGLSGYKEEESLIEDARWATGISNPSMAVTTGSSATEAAIVKEATLKRLRASLAMNRTIFFERIGELRMKNILQHYQDPIKVNKVTGENGEERWQGVYRSIQTPDDKGKFSTITVKPEDLRGNFTFYVKPSTDIPLSKELVKEQRRQTFDKIIPLPVVDPEKAVRWLFKGENDDPDAVLMTGIGVPNAKLAAEENARMMQGANLPPTLNATPQHTLEHYKFMKENAWQIDENVDRIMSAHINGELNPVSPAGVGGITPPVGADGAAIGTPPIPGAGALTGEAGGGMGAPGQGAQPNGLPPAAGGEIPAAADGGSAIAPDVSMDQQLQR